MVKEIFLISDGLPIFHHSRDQNLLEDSDKVLLSSGFLSALKNFSETERSEAIDSFSTEHEYFLFMRYQKSEKMLVGVFDKEIPQKIARKGLNKIHDLIVESGLFRNTMIVELGTSETNTLKEKISEIINQIFGIEGEYDRLNELLTNRTDIPLAFLIMLNEKKVIAHFARPKPLFREQQVKEFFLLLSTIQTTLSRLQIPQTFTYFIVKSSDYTIASVLSGLNASVATGSPNTPEEDVLNVALQIVHYTSLESLIGSYQSKQLVNHSTLTKDGNLENIAGIKLNPTLGVFLSTLSTRLSSFFKLLTRRDFESFQIIITEKIKRDIIFSRDNSKVGFTLKIFEFS